MGFIIHFYIIFGTNLLTGGPAQIAVFCLFQCFAEKDIKRSPNGMKPSGTWFSEQTSSRGLGVVVKQQTRKPQRREARLPPWARPHPRGPLVAPPTYFFLLYIPTYPQTIKEHNENLIPLPQPYVSTRSHPGACSGALPEGASIMEGFYINTIASPMKCE